MNHSGIVRGALAAALAGALLGALVPAAHARTAQDAQTAQDKAQTVTGTVTKVQASQRTVTVALTDGGEGVFVWNPDTKINGTLTPGARVTIRYQSSADSGGRNLALQITVARS